MKFRRNLLKSALGIGVVGGSISSSWVKPVVDTVVLPVHAETSAIATFRITVASTNFSTDQCGSNGETVQIDGTVQASDGRDLSGTMLNIKYTDNPSDGDFTDIPVIVQSGNTYSFSGFVEPSVGEWDFFPYQIVVSFTDQSTYGNATATTTGNCSNRLSRSNPLNPIPEYNND